MGVKIIEVFKKISLAFVLLFFLIPKEGLASSGVIPYDGVKVTTTVPGFNLGNWSDGELSTSNTLKSGDNVYLDLTEEYTITGHNIVSDLNTNSTIIQFYDAGNKIISPGVSYAGVNQTYLYKGVKRIRLYNGNTGAWKISELQFHSDKVIYEPVMKITETHTHEMATLRWELPKDTKFNGVVVSKDGFNIADLPSTSTSLVVRDLTPNTLYKFSVVTKFTDGTLSAPVKVEVLTSEAPPPPKPAGDVKDLQASAEHDRVDLSWNLPASSNFKHVNIYRYEVQETALIDRILMIESVSAATGKKIFETNGTYFNDLTVSADTTYQYTLTTTSKEALESVGVSTTVKTPVKPPTEIAGGEFEKDPATGSYIYRWTEPTTGKVKVMVGGKLYTTVNASNKVVVIPAKDMKYKGLDEPDVYLIPVAEDGTEGNPVKPPAVGGGTGGMLDEVELPFDAGELLGTGTGLFWLIGPFVLLSLAFLLVPKLRNMLVRAFTGDKGNSDGSGRRFRSDEERQREERTRIAREREVNAPRNPVERQQRAMKEPRERVHKARMTREERRST